MIKELKDIRAIAGLWQAAFHDSEEEIRFFAENVQDAVCLAYCIEDKPVSLLYLVDCEYNGVSGGYVYAACTDAAFRKQGIMAQLLAYCRTQKPYICLLPANEQLVEYYKKQGFTKVVNTNEIVFSQSPEILEYLYDGCELEKPIILMTEEA